MDLKKLISSGKLPKTAKDLESAISSHERGFVGFVQDLDPQSQKFVLDLAAGSGAKKLADSKRALLDAYGGESAARPSGLRGKKTEQKAETPPSRTVAEPDPKAKELLADPPKKGRGAAGKKTAVAETKKAGAAAGKKPAAEEAKKGRGGGARRTAAKTAAPAEAAAAPAAAATPVAAPAAQDTMPPGYFSSGGMFTAGDGFASGDMAGQPPSFAVSTDPRDLMAASQTMDTPDSVINRTLEMPPPPPRPAPTPAEMQGAAFADPDQRLASAIEADEAADAQAFADRPVMDMSLLNSANFPPPSPISDLLGKNPGPNAATVMPTPTQQPNPWDRMGGSPQPGPPLPGEPTLMPVPDPTKVTNPWFMMGQSPLPDTPAEATADPALFDFAYQRMPRDPEGMKPKFRPVTAATKALMTKMGFPEQQADPGVVPRAVDAALRNPHITIPVAAGGAALGNAVYQGMQAAGERQQQEQQSMQQNEDQFRQMLRAQGILK